MTKAPLRPHVRCQIATLWQKGGKTRKEIAKSCRVSLDTVDRWKNIPLNEPENFNDQERCGRSHAIREDQVEVFKEAIETGGVGNLKRAASEFHCDRSTVTRTISRLGGVLACNQGRIVLAQRDIQKRLSFAKAHLHADFTTWTMFDDKSLEVPPPPPHKHNAPQYRFEGSSKPVKRYKTKKRATKILMFVGANYNGKSEPVFNVKRHDFVRKDGYRYDTFNINVAEVKNRLKKVVYPFMQRTGSTVLAMDNALVQAQAVLATKHPHITAVGFQSEKLNKEVRAPGGIPPSSPDTSWLDCGLFGPFEIKFREANPQTIEEAMTVATKLWHEIPMSDVRKLIDHYPRRLQELVQSKGSWSSWQRSDSVEKCQ